MTESQPRADRSIVHLVRHGEVANPRGILYGRLPGFLLSEDGRLMAKAAADFLAGRDVTLLRSSPLERAAPAAPGPGPPCGIPGVPEGASRTATSWRECSMSSATLPGWRAAMKPSASAISCPSG